MTDHVYRLLELVGSSPSSIEDAVQIAIDEAHQHLRHIHWFQIVETRGHVEGGKVKYYQVTIKVGYTIEETTEHPAR